MAGKSIVSGKPWKAEKSAYRRSGLSGTQKSSYEKRMEEKRKIDEIKERERKLKEEKDEERSAHAQRIRARREAKAEKERMELLQAKLHQKVIDRRRRREKRNKTLKER
ncbi:CGR1 family protein [Schizosaccharomyces cryophilus OY26]|uniref:rRNA-processing protein n=1 Tax=Schizosaccharomyces cryophilus (strain OY26 / ATCC MYA-4695 / CBS 11777 / NBRC 106824 / NRRL Y48691) TaxID=653667 RepID=S9X382_SCHCR|nr:CGR1 family protein [Schizosaccharomyces cryophilus OY26]EPY51567.1 CGR1 family protein [Schizosaccharomyces cryophilus OY26]